MNIREMTKKMSAYFKKCVDSLENNARKDLMAPSFAGLCKEIGATKSQLLGLDGGTDEEQEFYDRMLLEFEYAVEETRSKKPHLIPKETYQQLQKELFSNTGTASENKTVVIFPNWNAPVEYEDFLDIKHVCETTGLELRFVVGLIKKYGPKIVEELQRGKEEQSRKA